MKAFAVILLLFPAIYFSVAGIGQVKKFSGRIIYVDNNEFIVKYESKEVSFGITPQMIVKTVFSDVSSASSDLKLEICQYVNVMYEEKEGKKNAARVDILKESDCHN